MLGEIGPNFGAGMTGGRAFLLADGETDARLNRASVQAGPLDADDERVLLELLTAHSDEGSSRAADVLRDWDPRRFVVVAPIAAVEAPADQAAQAAMAR